MRTIHRDIVGGFIFSNDGKILLGKHRKGGVYEGKFLVPAGGVEEGETKEMALKREMKEETGIEIDETKIKFLGNLSGEHPKTLTGSGERVFVKMDFYNYRIDIERKASEITIIAEDDWYQPRWFDASELKGANLSDPTRDALIASGVIKI